MRCCRRATRRRRFARLNNWQPRRGSAVGTMKAQQLRGIMRITAANRWVLGALGALFWISACAPVSAQEVHKCRSRGSVTYSQQPCSGRLVSTEQAQVRVKPNPKHVDIRRIEENRVMARTLRKKPGESAGQFETRRRRARLLAPDRAECARLDKRMPVEEASMNNPDRMEALGAEAALQASRKRFGELRC